MKSIHIFVIVLCSVFFSCQTANDQILLDPEESLNTDMISSATNRTQYATASKLQWTAYIAAKVILHNKKARGELVRLLGRRKQVPLTTLIGVYYQNFDDDAPASRSDFGQADAFTTAFIEETGYYIVNNGNGREEGIEEIPPGEISPCCAGPMSIDERVLMFLIEITTQHCFELYFPNGLNDELEMINISSTGHPLTNEIENFGFLRYPEIHIFEEFDYEGYAHEVHIGGEYIEEYETIIVARPIQDDECDYRMFGVEDFTLFLNNNN